MTSYSRDKGNTRKMFFFKFCASVQVKLFLWKRRRKSEGNLPCVVNIVHILSKNVSTCLLLFKFSRGAVLVWRLRVRNIIEYDCQIKASFLSSSPYKHVAASRRIFPVCHSLRFNRRDWPGGHLVNPGDTYTCASTVGKFFNVWEPKNAPCSVPFWRPSKVPCPTVILCIVLYEITCTVKLQLLILLPPSSLGWTPIVTT